jgi:hypothetical protein
MSWPSAIWWVMKSVLTANSLQAPGQTRPKHVSANAIARYSALTRLKFRLLLRISNTWRAWLTKP